MSEPAFPVTMASMPEPDKDHAVLLEAPDWAEACMARNVLAEAGIPSLLRGINSGLLEWGPESQSATHRPDLLVPAPLLERARAALSRAWPDRE